MVYKTTDNVMSLDQFVAACSPHLAVPEDVQLLQAEMVRQGLLCVSALQQGLQVRCLVNSSKICGGYTYICTQIYMYIHIRTYAMESLYYGHFGP